MNDIEEPFGEAKRPPSLRSPILPSQAIHVISRIFVFWVGISNFFVFGALKILKFSGKPKNAGISYILDFPGCLGS